MRIFWLSFVLLGAFLSFAGAQTPPADPGDYLLHVAKSLADSGRLDDPDIAGSLLHMSVSRSSHYQGWWHNSCPAGGYNFDDEYAVTGINWFHTLPTGTKNMRTFPPVVGDIAMPPTPGNPGPFPYDIIGSPNFGYDVGVIYKCVGLGYGLISARIDFGNIPGYACISRKKIETIFPNLGTYHYQFPLSGSFLTYLAAGNFLPAKGLSPSVSVDETKPFAAVDFVMTQPQGRDAVCLLEMHIHAAYQFGGVHDLPGQVPYPQAETHPLSPGQ